MTEIAELFPVEIVLSPRLAWMKLHNLETEDLRHLGGMESPETCDEIPLWVCRTKKPADSLYAPREIGGGDTIEEACIDWAINAGVKIWTEELP